MKSVKNYGLVGYSCLKLPKFEGDSHTTSIFPQFAKSHSDEFVMHL
jgi:hypothetical protein